jgi:hypothetical protein
MMHLIEGSGSFLITFKTFWISIARKSLQANSCGRDAIRPTLTANGVVL